MHPIIILAGLSALFFIMPLSGMIPAHAQTITVNNTTPCFLNYTEPLTMLDRCGLGEDYLTFSLLGWEWITGGYFSMVFVSIFIFAVYVKYHKMMYPILIGVMFLPIAWFVFPEVFLSWGIIMAFLGIGIGTWYVFIRQTKEY